MRCVSCLEEEFHESWLPGVSLFFHFRIRNRLRRDDSVCLGGGRGIFVCLNENDAATTSNYRVELSTIPQIFVRRWKRDHGQRWKGVGAGKERMASFCRLRPWNSAILLPQDAIAASFLRTFVKSCFEFRRYRWWEDILFYSALVSLSLTFRLSKYCRRELLLIENYCKITVHIFFKIRSFERNSFKLS